MPRPRGAGTSTICFRVINDTRDLLIAAAYDYEKDRADATGRYVDPDDVNISDLIRTVLDDWLAEYASLRGGPNLLIRALLEARAEQSAARHTEALARLEEVDAVTTTADSAATRQGRRSAKLAQTQGLAKADPRADAGPPARPAKTVQKKPISHATSRRS
jgi:hypothetical protein